MGAYTAEGLAEQEEDSGGGGSSRGTTSIPDPKESLSSVKVVSSHVASTSHTPMKSRSSNISSPHTPR